MNTSFAKYTRITGTGSHLPKRRVSNGELAARLAADGIETSDSWIVERTGIKARYFAEPGALASDLAVLAARHALEAASRRPEEVDLIIVATSTPDMIFPSTACIVHSKLGMSGGAAFDVQAVCTGFVYALALADLMIKTGLASKALVIGTEVFSRILDFKDRTTCVLFGDGAGAVVLEASDAPGLLASELHADGRHVGILCVPGTVAGGQVLGDFFVVRALRRSGVGLTAATAVMRATPGRWTLGFQDYNPGARSFWTRVATAVAGDSWRIEHQPVPGKPELPPDSWLTIPEVTATAPATDVSAVAPWP